MKRFLKIFAPLALVFVVALFVSGCAKSTEYGIDALYTANLNFLEGESSSLDKSDFRDKKVENTTTIYTFDEDYNGLLQTKTETLVERQGKYINQAGNITYPKLHIKVVTHTDVYNDETKEVEVKVTTSEYYFSNGEQYVYNTGTGFTKTSTSYSSFVSSHSSDLEYLTTVQDDIFAEVSGGESYSFEDSVDKSGNKVTLTRVAKTVDGLVLYDLSEKIVITSNNYSSVARSIVYTQKGVVNGKINQTIKYTYSANIVVPELEA